jgi:hypothetical protein
MSLTAREAFKTGFVARCVENGMDTAAILALVKSSMDKVAILGPAMNLTGHLANVATRLGVLALAAPPIAGGLIGWTAARARDISDEDVKGIKDQEIMDAYRSEAEKLRRQRESRTARLARQMPKGRSFQSI